MNKLGERVRTLREQCGLSKAELARRVGVSDVTVSYWENGTIQQVGHSRLEPLSRALRCSIQYLLGDEKADAERSAPPTLPLYTLTLKPESITQHATPMAYMPAILFDAPPIAQPDSLSTDSISTDRLPTDALPTDYLLVPKAGDRFDYCRERSFLLARPCRSFNGEGLYLLERQERLMIRRVRQPQAKRLELFSEEHEGASLVCCQRDELEFHARIAAIWAPCAVG